MIINCPKCGQPMQEVIAAEAKQRAGFYCVGCKEFVKATGRERFLEKEKQANG